MEAKKIFRPTLGYCIRKSAVAWFLFPALALGVWALVLLLNGRSLRSLIGLMLPVILFGAIGIHIAIKLLRTYIAVDGESICTRIEGATLTVLWRNIVAAQFQAAPQQYIQLHEKQISYSIPVGYFQVYQLWEECKTHFASEMLMDAAMEQVDGYKELLEQKRLLVQDQTTSLRVKLWGQQILAMIVFLVAIWCAFLGLRSTFDWAFIIIAVFFVLSGVYLFITSGSVEMNAQQLEYLSWLGHYAIRWDEITQVEVDEEQNIVVLANADKSLPAQGPNTWFRLGKDGLAMGQYLNAQLAIRKIPVQPLKRALFRWPKNVRIPNSK